MPNKKFQVPINLVNLNADPATGSEGDMYFNTTLLQIRSYINGAWRSMASGTSTTTDATQVHLYVKNGTSDTLPKGSVVYINGSDGTNITVDLAQANMEGLSSKTLGFLETDLAPNSGTGYVATDGVLSGINTNGGNAGDPIWLSPTVAGGVIYGLANKPSAPNHLVYLGVMTKKSAGSGEIFIHVQNGFELYELHNVSLDPIASIADNEVLAYDSATTLWKNKTASEAGLAALSGATFTGAIYGTSLTLSGDLTISGTTTTVNTTTLSVKDKNVELGVVASPTNTTADGGGITLKGSTDKTFNWVNSTSSWTSSENIDLASGKTFKINTTDVLSATSLAIGLSGTTGQITLKSAATGTSIIKPTDANAGSLTFTLGTTSGTLATTGQTFYIGTTPITIAQGTGTITSIAGLTSLSLSTTSSTSPFTVTSSQSNTAGGNISISSSATATGTAQSSTSGNISLTTSGTSSGSNTAQGGNIYLTASSSGTTGVGGSINISTSGTNANSISIASAGGFTISSTNIAGTIDNFNIGATTAGTGKFTSLNATSIGATTAGTGNFTSLSINNNALYTPLYYSNYSDISSGAVLGNVPITLFGKSVALLANTVYEVEVSWLMTLQAASALIPRLWWGYSGTLDSTNPIAWEARYTQVSGNSSSVQYLSGETAGATNQVYVVTAVRTGTTSSPLVAGPGYTAASYYASKVTAKALVRTTTAGNLSFNIQAGITGGASTGYSSFFTKAGSFMKVTPIATNAGADISLPSGSWA